MQREWCEEDVGEFMNQFSDFWPNFLVKNIGPLFQMWLDAARKFAPQTALRAIREIYEAQEIRRAPTLKMFKETSRAIEGKSAEKKEEFCPVCHGAKCVPIGYWTISRERAEDLVFAGKLQEADCTGIKIDGKHVVILEPAIGPTIPESKIERGEIWCDHCSPTATPPSHLAKNMKLIFEGRFFVHLDYKHLGKDFVKIVFGTPSSTSLLKTADEISKDDDFWSKRTGPTYDHFIEQMRKGAVPF